MLRRPEHRHPLWQQAQQAELDDNGIAVRNELLDGLAASRNTIGCRLAGDDPLVNTLSVNAILVAIDETIRAQQLAKKSNGDYADRSFGLCGPAGSYDVTVYAIDEDGETSLPATTIASRTRACDDFGFLNGFE